MDIGIVVALVICLLVVFVIKYVKTDAKYKHDLEHVFANRPALTGDEFYQHYFADTGVSQDVVVGILEILEQQLDIDLSRLAAEDDFSKNLAFLFDFDSMADVAIVVALEERFDIDISDKEAASAKSVNQIVRLIHKKQSEKASRFNSSLVH
uniref:acyl carrier protein n=1 Tax=Thaumasiovibrio occultus TaxID=1891184 RepID=UPI000B34ACD6|nr:phosphopantetheine-binding protein [Thaumasiovibrio occultus]